MSDEYVDKATGRVKEAAGALAGDKSLKNEGRVEQAKAAVKKTVDKVTGKHDEHEHA
ncbi:MAG: CsbD family protein [Solirubrobacterales bacterium]|nr:CsbD family protein [Solirubrobacterales bacterium]